MLMYILTFKIKPPLCFFNFSPGVVDAFNWPKPPKKITGHVDYKQRLKAIAMLTIFWQIKSKGPGEACEIGSKKRQRQEMWDCQDVKKQLLQLQLLKAIHQT